MAGPKRVCFDTTVLWGAFHGPAGPNFKLLELAAQRSPVLDGFVTDAIAAEFWWRATQQGVKGPGASTRRTYTDDELEPFFQAFGVLLEPDATPNAPLGRTLGRYAGLVGLGLGEVLYAITGKDKAALLAAPTTAFAMTFESVDIADLPRASRTVRPPSRQLRQPSRQHRRSERHGASEPRI
jgi:hypothetical protein